MIKQRSLLLVPFPFSDRMKQKVRPALVVSCEEYNARAKDVIVCAVTSQRKRWPYLVEIQPSDLESGTLYEVSFAKVDSLLRLDKSRILKEIGRIDVAAFSQVHRLIARILKRD
ncbi:MAG: type II toxin-antitoxin system PemK/MazF family toxin [Candidatus Latescibacteria bacterium]|nr:type II toxin-antitoxin system PemK/MazF family toxin [Candidatus Latescibacterota bacterium]